ncbi:MAG: ribonuclease III family protein [Candidatus Helarchaeota archaeon]
MDINFNKILKNYKGLSEVFKDKKLAQLGDNLINFIYSLAKSIELESPQGWKVSANVLSQAMRDSDLRKFAPKRANSHDIGDFAEALTAYVWLLRKLTLQEATEILIKNLKGGSFSDIKKEERIATIAFTELFKKIKEKLNLNKPKNTI